MTKRRPPGALVRLRKWGKDHVQPDPDRRRAWCGRRWLSHQARDPGGRGICVDCTRAWKRAARTLSIALRDGGKDDG